MWTTRRFGSVGLSPDDSTSSPAPVQFRLWSPEMWRACWPRACFAQPDHRPPLEASHTMKLDYHDLANRLASPSRQRAQGRDNIPACATCQPSNGLVGEPLNPALRAGVTLVPSSRPHQTGPIGSPCIAGALRRNVGGLSLTSTPNVIYRTPTAKTAHEIGRASCRERVPSHVASL